MNKRLSRSEMRIIEETKREGAGLERAETEAGPGAGSRRASVLSIVWFVVIFALLVAGFSLLIGLTL